MHWVAGNLTFNAQFNADPNKNLDQTDLKLAIWKAVETCNNHQFVAD